MPDIEKMAETVIKHLGRLGIEASRCTRVRSPMSKCQACMDICPTNGIKVSRAGIDINACIECGVCSTVCPGGALKWRALSPLALVNKVDETVGVYGEAYIYCSKHIPRKKSVQGIEVSCLGSIPWECWVKLLLYADRLKIIMSQGWCSSCPQGLKDTWEQEIRTARAVAHKEPVFISEIADRCRKKTVQGVNRERRQLFGAVAGGIGNLPGKIFQGLFGDSSGKQRLEANSTAATERRQVLKLVIKENPLLKDKITLRQPVISGDCRFCKACSTLCPRGALKQKRLEEKVVLEMDSLACSGCGLCVSACYHQALELREMHLHSLEEKRIMAQGENFTCSSCGSKFYALTEKECPACENKQQRLWEVN